MCASNRWITIVALAAIAACGSKEPVTSAKSARTTGGAASSVNSNVSATAEEVAEAARGKVKCPAKVKTPKRDAKAPVDDVVGVRPGMTYDEASNLVMCTHELLVIAPATSRRFNIQTYGQTLRQGFNAALAQPKVQRTSKQIMQEMQDRSMARGNNKVIRDMHPGQAKWYVGTMGLPGEERVINAAREEWFEEGRNPTVTSVQQALLKKYGTPTETFQDARAKRWNLRWAHDPFGRLITETSPLFRQCDGTADPDGASTFSPDCGVVVAAVVHGLASNPDLAEYLQVGVVDQAGGYEALTATEQGLQQLEAQRRAQETEAASQNADAPTL